MRSDISRKRVLVVDDAPSNIQMLMETLRDEYAVAAALDGRKALNLANNDPAPDIILLDVLMPDMDGYEVCSQLKAGMKTKGIPVIFVTSNDDDEDEQKGLLLGAVDYIHKPFNPALLRTRVRNHLTHKLYRDHLEDVVNERTRELVLTRDAIIYGLSTLAEYRDIETGKHIKRAQHYVRHLAETMKNSDIYGDLFTEENICLISKSAQLHDVGKVGVPDRILFKPGKLTDEEFRTMKTHIQIGRDSISKIENEMAEYVSSSFLKYAAEIAYTHHERWDGTGYLGMTAEEIPISGRLMALADVYDALTSKRVYKPAISHEEAVHIITKGDGRTEPHHFDPDVLQAFISVEDKFRETAQMHADPE